MKVLPKPMRVGGQRRYGREAADLVAVVRLAQACGFSIPEMQRLVHDFEPRTTPSVRLRTAAHDHREVLQEQIAKLKSDEQIASTSRKVRMSRFDGLRADREDPSRFATRSEPLATCL